MEYQNETEMLMALLENNPNIIKQSLELAIKSQTKILDATKERKTKVMCNTLSCDSIENVPKECIVLIDNDFENKTQYLNIEYTNEIADDKYIQSLTSYLSGLQQLYDNFDSITVEDILKVNDLGKFY